jgi:hypothetical protein
MLKNGTYRIQSPTGRVNEVLLFAPDGTLVGFVKRLDIQIDPKNPDVRGTIVMANDEVHQLLRVKFSARGVIIDGEAKENPGGSSRQLDIEDLVSLKRD